MVIGEKKIRMGPVCCWERGVAYTIAQNTSMDAFSAYIDISLGILKASCDFKREDPTSAVVQME